jgi:hypothetical protein
LFLGIAFALVLAVGIAAAGPHGRQFRSPAAEAFERAQPFSVSGQFSGTINGEMVIDDLPYRLAPTATAYEIGNGTIPLGTDVQNRYVTLFGLKMAGTSVVYSVFVRPAGEATFETSDLSSQVHIRNASAPR